MKVEQTLQLHTAHRASYIYQESVFESSFSDIDTKIDQQNLCAVYSTWQSKETIGQISQVDRTEIKDTLKTEQKHWEASLPSRTQNILTVCQNLHL